MVIFRVGGGVVTLNQVLPNQNLAIYLFQAQFTFGLVLSRVGWAGVSGWGWVGIKTKAKLAQFQMKLPARAKLGNKIVCGLGKIVHSFKL